MSEQVLIAIVMAIGSAGGLATLIKAILDYRANKASRIEDADERLVARLERRLDEAEKRIEELERQRDTDAVYIVRLTSSLIHAGIDLPQR